MSTFSNPWASLTGDTRRDNGNPVNYLNSGPMKWQLITSNWRIAGAPLRNVGNSGQTNKGGGKTNEILQDVQAVAQIADTVMKILPLL